MAELDEREPFPHSKGLLQPPPPPRMKKSGYATEYKNRCDILTQSPLNFFYKFFRLFHLMTYENFDLHRKQQDPGLR